MTRLLHDPRSAVRLFYPDWPIAAVLGASALVAALVPALIATRVGPADVMRVES